MFNGVKLFNLLVGPEKNEKIEIPPEKHESFLKASHSILDVIVIYTESL